MTLSEGSDFSVDLSQRLLKCREQKFTVLFLFRFVAFFQHVASVGWYLQMRAVYPGVKEKVHSQVTTTDVIKNFLHFHVFTSELCGSFTRQ